MAPVSKAIAQQAEQFEVTLRQRYGWREVRKRIANVIANLTAWDKAQGIRRCGHQNLRENGTLATPCGGTLKRWSPSVGADQERERSAAVLRCQRCGRSAGFAGEKAA